MATISQFPSVSFDDTAPPHVSSDSLSEKKLSHNTLLSAILGLVALVVFCYSFSVYQQVIEQHVENKLLLQENSELTRRNVRLVEENAELNGTLVQVLESQRRTNAELKSILNQAQQTQ